MGEEISTRDFSAEDRVQFQKKLEEETQHLKHCLDAGDFDQDCISVGAEIEAWFIDKYQNPYPINMKFLEELGEDPLVAPELSLFNIEFNTIPRLCRGDAIAELNDEMYQRILSSEKVSQVLGAHLLMIGSLPTVRSADLQINNICPYNRYYSLNQQLMKLRNNRPIDINITGVDTLSSRHQDVMLESAATSFQVHIQVPEKYSAHYYNSSLLVTAPLLAASTNSPFLFGRTLWEETRIPIFEQGIDSFQKTSSAKRVTFGENFMRNSLFPLFEENLTDYSVILPQTYDTDKSEYSHLRIHNGTVWRWVRPIVGYDKSTKKHHVRIEQRVLPSGPTVADMIANLSFYIGVSHYIASIHTSIHEQFSFHTLRNNFYTCAQKGLLADIQWTRARTVGVKQLLINELIPMAREGLNMLSINEDASKYYLDLIEDRVKSGQTGSQWQRRFIQKNGKDFVKLIETYFDNQCTNAPVHSWKDG